MTHGETSKEGRQEALHLIKSLIADCEEKGKLWRKRGQDFIISSSLVILFLSLIIMFAKTNSLNFIIPLYGIVFIVFLGRSFLALATAYNSRCGQLEDMLLYLLLTEKTDLSRDDILKALVSLRRDFLRDVVKSSVPDMRFPGTLDPKKGE